MKLRTIVIDDSSLQRMIISKLVDNHPKLLLSGDYKSALETYQQIKDGDVDLMVLDVEMPVLSGLDFLVSLENPPQTILISRNPDYAVKAFDYGVTYYLLKPLSEVKFDTAIKKVIQQREYLQAEKERGSYVYVKSNFKKVKIFIKEIKWVEALHDYVRIVTKEQSIIVLSTLKRMEKLLPKDEFLRIHRSFLVNMSRVEKFNHKNLEIDGKILPLSRKKKAAVSEKLI